MAANTVEVCIFCTCRIIRKKRTEHSPAGFLVLRWTDCRYKDAQTCSTGNDFTGN